MNNEIRHIKITCEHCGCIIDISEGNVCENCGAVHDSSKHIQQYNDMQRKMNKLKIETAEAELEGIRLSNARKKQQLYSSKNKKKSTVKTILKIWIAMAVSIMVLSTIGLFLSGDWRTSYEYSSETIIEAEPEIVETPTEVSFGETAELIQYSVICDKVEQYDYPWTKPKEGFYYVNIHIIVSNKTDKTRYAPRDDDMICRYIDNGYTMAAERCTISSNDLGTKISYNTIDKQSSTAGSVYYEVPLNTDLIFVYDDYVTINIPAESIVMLEK